MTVEGVATRAGAGKATIYRRWPSKEALVVEAIRRVVLQISWPDTGNARQDVLDTMLSILRTMLGTGIQASGFPRLVSSLTGNPPLMAVYWERVVLPAREAIRRILQRGITRGEIRADLDLDAALDMLPGSIFFRVVTAAVNKPPTPDYLERVVETFWQGFAPRSPRVDSGAGY